jgi:hypothetical protein
VWPIKGPGVLGKDIDIPLGLIELNDDLVIVDGIKQRCEAETRGELYVS